MVRLGSLKTGVAISALALLAFSGSAISTAAPAAARIDISVGLNFGGIGFGYFHRNLGRRGHWINHPIWGDVWMAPRGWRPYFNGYWRYSDYGLLWIGFDPWSDITEHYGRWVWDRYYGTWLWIPGYVWGPGWVLWRSGGGYFGWLAMPPDYGDFYDGPYFGGRYGWDDYYGYEDWYGLSSASFFDLWIFVDDNHFYSRDYRSYAFSDSRRISRIMNSTRDMTNYVVQGDRVFNRSISADRLERLTHERIQPVEARKLLKGNVPMATVTGGRALARREGSGQSGPHFHDSNFQPLAGHGARGERGASSLIPREPDRATMRGRARGGDNEATPNTGSQPNVGEGLGRGRNREHENQVGPTGPQPNLGEERGRGRTRGGDNEAAPSPQPTGGEERRGHNRGGENEAAPAPQPQPNGAEDRGGRGRHRGGENQMSPSPQQQPNADEGGARPRGQNAQGRQGRERPNASGEKEGDEQSANPDEDKRKKRDRDEPSPQH